MKVIEKRFLRGPSLHSRRPCFMAVIDLEELDDVASSDIQGFTEKLCALLPTLSEHRCSLGYRGGFVERLKEGTYMAHITEHVLIELQCLAGSDVGFGKARQVRGKPRHYTIVCSYHIEHLVDQALPVAIDLVTALAKNETYDLAAALQPLKDIVERYAPGPSTRSILDAAREHNIPFFRMDENTSLYQLGWGHKQQRIQATITSQTSYIGVELASNKHLTKTLLAEVGIPVPKGEIVTGVEDAIHVLKKMRGPLAVKPLDANQGKGVTLNITTTEDMIKAFVHAQSYSKKVILEQCIQGDDYRVLVIGDQVVAASRRSAPCVKGDGRHSIQQLVEAENLNPLRGKGHSNALTKIPLDKHAHTILAKQGFTPQTILAPGQLAKLRDNANLSTGGTAEDVTDLLPTLTKTLCVRAAKRIGLDVAGIDIVCQDITAPLQFPQAAIIEINAAPGIRMHEWPSAGLPRNAGKAIINNLFKEGQTGRIPLTAVTGTNGKTTTALLIAKAWEASGKITGMTCTEGIFINSQNVSKGDCTGYWSARTILSSPEVEVAVLETARGGILKRGLGFDQCDVSVVLNITSDHLGQNGVDDLEDLAAVKRVVARAATKTVVLNADDPLCVEMAGDIDPDVEILYFSLQHTTPLLKAHTEKGGRSIVVEESAILLVSGHDKHILLPLSAMPFAFGGLVAFNVANALAAIGALIAQSCPLPAIRKALTEFRSNAQENPLRMNIFNVGDVKVLIDYAHNAAAYEALGTVARHMAKGGRTIAVVTAPGDRRDEDLEEIGSICARVFDEIIIYEMDDKRGRAEGIAAELLLKGATAQLDIHDFVYIPDVRSALAHAIHHAKPHDLVILGCANDLKDLQDAVAQVRGKTIQAVEPHTWIDNKEVNQPATLAINRGTSHTPPALPASAVPSRPSPVHWTTPHSQRATISS